MDFPGQYLFLFLTIYVLVSRILARSRNNRHEFWECQADLSVHCIYIYL